jgi:uncharacterized protein YbjQ (UPF0145 family)
MTKNLLLSRADVVKPMWAEAQAEGGKVRLAMRLDTSETSGRWTEICAFGTTAVVVVEHLG